LLDLADFVGVASLWRRTEGINPTSETRQLTCRGDRGDRAVPSSQSAPISRIGLRASP
jgi:hypothetical protein